MKQLQEIAEAAGYTMVEFAEWPKKKRMMYKLIFSKDKQLSDPEDDDEQN